MAEPYIGDIKMMASNFAPRHYAFCSGTVIAISSNQALFSLLGTVYGGDGRTSFALPDMRGRVPVHKGKGPGLSNWPQGQRAGIETVTLTANQLPSHNHTFRVSSASAMTESPEGAVIAKDAHYLQSDKVIASGQLNDAVLAPAGGDQPHSHPNMAPYLGISFVIALLGTYPSRN
jgi:microcystin-dependent protein